MDFSSLQNICNVVAKIKEQLIDDLPHHTHQSLFFNNDEITTGLLNNQTEISIHLTVGKLLYFQNERGSYIDLINDNISEKLQTITEKHNVQINTEKLENPKQQDLDIYRFFAAQSKKILEMFRMDLDGNFTFVHLWPHNFDFSVKWFTDKGAKYIETGISPGDKKYPMPYLYMNPFPFDPKTSQRPLPLGQWHTSGWNGIKVEWSEIVGFHPEEAANHISNLFFIAKENFK